MAHHAHQRPYSLYRIWNQYSTDILAQIGITSAYLNLLKDQYSNSVSLPISGPNFYKKN